MTPPEEELRRLALEAECLRQFVLALAGQTPEGRVLRYQFLEEEARRRDPGGRSSLS